VKGGCAGASWSPSEDCLALVSGEGKLLCMTSDWDVTAEVDFLPPASESAGARDSASDSASASASLEPGAVSISWRGDGAFFATSHVASHESQSQRGSRHPPLWGQVRVWEAGTCTLHSQSEELLPVHQRLTGADQAQGSGVSSSLPVAWQPSGALIAVGCSQASTTSAHGPPGGTGKQALPDHPEDTPSRSSQRGTGAASAGQGPPQEPLAPEGEPYVGTTGLEVVLLERNGMLRSRFPLQAPRGASLLALAWSSDSRVLAASCGAPATAPSSSTTASTTAGTSSTSGAFPP